MAKERHLAKYLTVLLVFIAAFSFNCKKRLIDYRNKYCSDWKFEYRVSSFSVDQNGIPNEKIETGNHTGRVLYDARTNDKGELQFEFAPDWTVIFTVDKDGKLRSCEPVGQFKDSDFVEFSSNNTGCFFGYSSSSFTVVGRR